MLDSPECNSWLLNCISHYLICQYDHIGLVQVVFCKQAQTGLPAAREGDPSIPPPTS